MQILYLVVLAIALGAAPPSAEKELSTELPGETVDYVLAGRLDAASADDLLRSLLNRLRMRPRYRLATFLLPGEERPHLIFIKGKDADVRIIKKMLTAMEEGASLLPGAGEGPFVMRYDLKEISAAEARARLIEAGKRIGIALTEEDFFIYPEGAGGSLFFVGAPELAPRITEVIGGLDRASPPGPMESAKEYFREMGGQVARAFGGLLSTVVSALILLLLHAVLGHLPVIGSRYRKSFRLFWERLFASFKGKDLAWEIIQAAAGLGVSASGLSLPAPEGVRGAVREKRERAFGIASDYIRWRGLDPADPGIRRLTEAAIDAESMKASSHQVA